MAQVSETETSEATKYLTYAALGVGTYVGYKMLFGGSKIESKHTYSPPDENELAEYPRDQKYWVSDPWEERPIRYSKKGVGALKPMTMMEVFEKGVKSNPNAIFYRQEVQDSPPNGEWKWRSFTRKEFYDLTRQTGRAFIALGLKSWESVCILGFNSPEWILADLGAIFAGGLAAGVYTTNNPGQCRYIADHCKARIAVCENESQLKKFLEIADTLKHLTTLVIWDGRVPEQAKSLKKVKVYTWEEMMAFGNDEKLDEEMNKRISAIKPTQCCTLIYTSGTTGPPKAVMLSHDNCTWNCRNLFDSIKDIDWGRQDHGFISYLPLSHIAAQLTDIHAPLAIMAHYGGNGMVTFARPDALKGSLSHTLKASKPTIFFGVPRVWEKMEETIKAIGKNNKGIKKMLADWAKSKGSEAHEAYQIGGSKKYPDGYNVAKMVVFDTIKRQLGFDRLEFAVSGAAPIKKSTIDYFGSLGINIVEVFGMSETTGLHTIGLNYYNRVGSVGTTGIGTETIILNDPSRDKKGEGEICMRGRNVMMGYMYDPDKTKETIDNEGLLHSGDVGRKDNQGLVYITGRIKELIITAGGENIAPVPIEDFIKTDCPALSNVMIIGDKRKFLTALVTLKVKQNLDTMEFTNELTGVALDVSPSCKTVDDAKKDEKWKKYIDNGFKKYNNDKDACVSNAQKIQYWRILDGDFSVPKDEMTSTLKLKRSVIHRNYEDIIEDMYKVSND